MIFTEVTHSSHPHILTPETIQTPFTCDGCKEAGWGFRFRCAECNYDLHKDCALAQPCLSHPFYKNCSFRFCDSGPAHTCCKACGKPALGFVYTVGDRSLHPRCANLQPVIKIEGLELHLVKRVWSTKCRNCNSRKLQGNGEGWSYRSTDKEYQFHVGCAKDMVNDLVITKWEQEQVCGDMDIATALPEMIKNCGKNGSSMRKKMKATSKKAVTVVVEVVLSVVVGAALADSHDDK